MGRRAGEFGLGRHCQFDLVQRLHGVQPRSFLHPRVPLPRLGVLLVDVRGRQLHELRRLRGVFTWSANADQWVAAASAHGVLVNHTPTVGAVAVWYGEMGWSGHVAVVEAVGANVSSVVISQQHMIITDGYDWVRIYQDPSKNQWQVWPNAFIHFPLASVVQPRAHDLSRVSAQFRARSAKANLVLDVKGS